ncbi:two-component system phosphate regulon response regulator OmpR [Rhodoligotrophos appendicifer]|uniref:response regulator n=1 Tax=Rhodoligotrophos appendicifer TaxID=987056 RepID=UPI001FE4E9B4|nr:response regulator [Rhodoligotrophos appendicifer]
MGDRDMGQEHIIVVDDEADLRDMLSEYLARHGFAVSVASNGEEMRAILRDRPAHLVTLDLRMPGEDGFALAKHLRDQGPIGIIMVTASSEKVDQIVGLELGADDYIAKPFDPRELLARVRSVLRRVNASTRGETQPAGVMGQEIRMGRCMFNVATAKLFTVDGREVPLTAMEFDLLKVFVERPNRVLSRDQLLDCAHHRDMDAFDRSIDIRIMRIRRKIEEDPGRPRVLRTVRGLGYMFVTADRVRDLGLSA